MAGVTLNHAQYLYFKAAESGIIGERDYFIGSLWVPGS